MSSEFQTLTEADLEDVIYLQDHVLAHIAVEHLPPYVLRRTPDYFEKHLKSPHRMIGLRAKGGKGKLIAQCAFHTPKNFTLVKETGLEDIPDFKEGDKVTIFQGALVHPEARGQGYMKAMIAQWMAWAEEQNIKHMLARVEINHGASLKAFKNYNFKNIGTIKDARDGASVTVFHKLNKAG